MALAVRLLMLAFGGDKFKAERVAETMLRDYLDGSAKSHGTRQ